MSVTTRKKPAKKPAKKLTKQDNKPSKKTRLPEKASDLILLALADLVKCERQKSKFDIAMDSCYYEPNVDATRCAVCFAGAVIAHSLGDGPESLSPEDFPRHTQRRLDALDEFRSGCVYYALREMGVRDKRAADAQDAMFDDCLCDLPYYNDDPRGFKLGMRRIAKKLASMGL